MGHMQLENIRTGSEVGCSFEARRPNRGAPVFLWTGALGIYDQTSDGFVSYFGLSYGRIRLIMFKQKLKDLPVELLARDRLLHQSLRRILVLVL